MPEVPSTVALPHPLLALKLEARCLPVGAARASSSERIARSSSTRIRIPGADNERLQGIAARFGMTLSGVVQNLLHGVPLPCVSSERPTRGDAALAQELALMRLQLARAVRAVALAEQGGAGAPPPSRPRCASARAHAVLAADVARCQARIDEAIAVIVGGRR